MYFSRLKQLIRRQIESWFDCCIRYIECLNCLSRKCEVTCVMVWGELLCVVRYAMTSILVSCKFAERDLKASPNNVGDIEYPVTRSLQSGSINYHVVQGAPLVTYLTYCSDARIALYCATFCALGHFCASAVEANCSCPAYVVKSRADLIVVWRVFEFRSRNCEVICLMCVTRYSHYDRYFCENFKFAKLNVKTSHFWPV